MMSFEIFLVFFILVLALLLLFTGWIRMDIVALLVLGSLAISGLLTPEEALSGFSNPAVVTVWAMYILSAALYQTGVAKKIGRQVLRLSGKSETRIIALIMISAGSLSAFINNIGVAALMLPVVMDIARSTGKAPSRLLMPLVFGCHLGGLTTLIGTPPNLLISFALEDGGLQGFSLFDYTPVGLGVMLAGIAFVALIGRHFLPRHGSIRDTIQEHQKALAASYALEERAFLIRIRPSSGLIGKTLAESRLRAVLGINVLSVKRDGGGTMLDPGPNTVLRPNDQLFVQGRREALKGLEDWKVLLPGQTGIDPSELLSAGGTIFETHATEKSGLIGNIMGSEEVKKHLRVNLLAVRKKGQIIRDPFSSIKIEAKDKLLLQGSPPQVEKLEKDGMIQHTEVVGADRLANDYALHEGLFIMEVAEASDLLPQAPEETHLCSMFGLTVLGIIRKGSDLYLPEPGEPFKAGDRVLVQGSIDNLNLVRSLLNIEVLDKKGPGAQSLKAEHVQMAEAVLAPRSTLVGKTLREINFRRKYGLTVLAIWGGGKVYRTNLNNVPLRFGEALLLYGKKDKIELISSEADFILLTDTRPSGLRTHKALTSVLIMLGILVPVLLGIIPLAISALIGIALMVLSGCLKMEEAYRAIEWRSVFLIAGLLPLGTAMVQTGAAAMLAEGVVNALEQFGPWGIVAGLYLLTVVSTLAIPPPALVVIMSPIALQTAQAFGISPHSIMMAIAIAATTSFLSPVSHPANLLVMGPGGYSFTDFLKLGLPLALVTMATAFVLLPVFWPL